MAKIEDGDTVVSIEGNLCGTVIAIGVSLRGYTVYLAESLTGETPFFMGTNKTLAVVKSASDHFREADIELNSLCDGKRVVRRVSWRKPGTL